ncbi:hypothetical protein DMB35_20415 [Acinetobacter baumannii A424]|nr:hypothetical protein DMB35_20415 [Acinetobacter baumannii A424]
MPVLSVVDLGMIRGVEINDQQEIIVRLTPTYSGCPATDMLKAQIVEALARHGGGAFSGKDPSKVDRSAAYAGRYVAKNIVAAGLADKCEIQVSYAIGVAEPTSISINTFGTAKVSDELIIQLVREHFDLRPFGITRMLNLIQPMYKQTAAYGHFGREGSNTAFTWEKTDKVEALKDAAGL